jgi:hypothetical protein
MSRIGHEPGKARKKDRIMSKTLVLSLVLLGSAWGSFAQAASLVFGQASGATIVQADDDEEDKKKKRGS